MPVGFRVFLKRNVPAEDLLEKFKHIPAANIADCMGRHNAMSPDIRVMTRPGEENMAGVALTVKSCNGDNLMIHKALDMANAGDVIVVSNEGGRNRSLMGEIMYRQAERKRLAGFVLDGPIRDVVEISSGCIPLYATGSTAGGPYKEGPGEINVPISCGGVHIAPGDLIVGDGDGVIVIPRRNAAKLLEAAIAFQAADRKKLNAALAGTADRSWVDAALISKKCEIIDGICESSRDT